MLSLARHLSLKVMLRPYDTSLVAPVGWPVLIVKRPNATYRPGQGHRRLYHSSDIAIEPLGGYRLHAINPGQVLHGHRGFPINSLPADSPKAIVAGITLAVLGIAFFMAMPIIVGAWSDQAGFSEQQAGLLAAIDSSGGVAASLFVSLVLNLFNRRGLAVGAIAIAVAANLASAQVGGFYPTAFCRALAGFGSGAIYALGLATLAATHHTARNFSILLFVQVSFGMVEINLYAWLADQTGMDGIYLSMALALTACLGLIHWLPPSAEEPSTSARGDSLNSAHALLPWLCLVAVFFFYIGTGAFWAYIERIGRAGGLEAGLVTGSLTYTQVLSLLGCLIAGWLSTRLGQFRPLIASLFCAAGASYGLTLGINAFSFVSALCVFFLFWNAIDIYQLGTLGNMDHRGRYVALVPAFQMTAAALGPALAALLLGLDGSYQPVLLLVGGCTTAAGAIYLYAYLFFRRSDPALAEAD